MQQTSPHKPITSKDNVVIKRIRSLIDPKHRRKEQAFLIEGVKMVEEALRDRAVVELVVASPALVRHQGKGVLKLAEHRAVEVVWIADRLMDFAAESKTPQPVLAIVKMHTHALDTLLDHDAGLVIVAHHLQDPGNLGTIIRTAEAAGASGLAYTTNTADPFGPKAVRASMGSILRLPLVHLNDITEFLPTCKQRGFQTLAAALTGERLHFDTDLKKPTVLVLGQEGGGLPQDILAAVDLRVRIPMAASIDSLNVATSAAIILYEAVRQRKS